MLWLYSLWRGHILTMVILTMAQVPRHEGEPSNWTDTTKAMGFGTVLGGGGGGGAPAKPSVVAFSGSGNTLGAASSIP